ncbi:hypothetical protein BcDW1_5228 [Botrytis cinerea BcDW1]|uniref:Uncharacterized protein n=1 Tax=Botryotinia fuckeliana (strain BcDW1) TaxID=1290391 RepID=M7UGY2_BOTF1|nr:hypothetical protein BcDW1_5228 [Botrytis cinerea BcDW1]
MAFSSTQQDIANLDDLSSLPTANSYHSSLSHTVITTVSPFLELAKSFNALLLHVHFLKWPKDEGAGLNKMFGAMTTISMGTNLLALQEAKLTEAILKSFLEESKVATRYIEGVIVMIETMKIDQASIFEEEEIEELQGFCTRAESFGTKLLALGIGIKWSKVFIPDNSIAKRVCLPHLKSWDLTLLPEEVADLEKAYRTLDPTGYRQYLSLIDSKAKECDSSDKEYDEKCINQVSELVNESIFRHSSEDNINLQKAPSFASAKTAVDDTSSTNPEKNTGNKIHYEAKNLHYVPAHKIQHWCRWTWFDLKIWPYRSTYILEEWLTSSNPLHSAEISKIKQRFQDAARRKMYGCGMRMEIKAGGDVERQMQEDCLRDVVNRLGEKAEKTLLQLCEGGHDIVHNDGSVRKYTIEAIEAREPRGIFNEPKIMGLEESLKMKRDLEFGRRKWWKKVRDFKGKEWWVDGKKKEWWLEAEKVEWVVVLKVEEIERPKKFMQSPWNVITEGKTNVSQEVRSSVGQGGKNTAQDNKGVNAGNVIEKKDTKEEVTMGIEEAERRMRILVKRLYVEENGDEKREM